MNRNDTPAGDPGLREESNVDRFTRDLPHALDFPNAWAGRLEGRKPAFFVDFDGTLTPIAKRPELAHLAASTRRTVQALAERYPVAVISGRDRADVTARVGLDEVICLGCHGLDFPIMDGKRGGHELSAAAERRFTKAGEALHGDLGGVAGTIIEIKKKSIAVHFRLVADNEVSKVRAAIRATGKAYPEFHIFEGNQVFEILPTVAWDKGRAVSNLMEIQGFTGADALPIYLGDDITDEAAFKAVRGAGIGILICGSEVDRPTAARYRLRDPNEVETFLTLLGQ
jgi:trehalose-phosphatase